MCGKTLRKNYCFKTKFWSHKFIFSPYIFLQNLTFSHVFSLCIVYVSISYLSYSCIFRTNWMLFFALLRNVVVECLINEFSCVQKRNFFLPFKRYILVLVLEHINQNIYLFKNISTAAILPCSFLSIFSMKFIEMNKSRCGKSCFL